MIKTAAPVALGDGQQPEVMEANHQVAMSVSCEIGGQQFVGPGDFRRIGGDTGGNPDRRETEQDKCKSEAIHVTDSRVNRKGRSIIGGIVQDVDVRGVGVWVATECRVESAWSDRMAGSANLKRGGWER